MLWIRIEANADPDPAFYLNADPDPECQTNPHRKFLSSVRLKRESLCEQSGMDWADRYVRHLPGEHRHQQAAHAPRRPDDRPEGEARGQPALQADAGQRTVLPNKRKSNLIRSLPAVFFTAFRI